MEEGWNITNHNVRVFNKFANCNGIHDINFTKGAPLSSIFLSYFLSICNNIAGNMDMILDQKWITSGLLSI